MTSGAFLAGIAHARFKGPPQLEQQRGSDGMLIDKEPRSRSLESMGPGIPSVTGRTPRFLASYMQVFELQELATSI